MAFNASGDLFVSMLTGGAVEEFTPNGAGTIFATGLVYPTGVAVDGAGNVYATSGNGNGIIEKYNTNGVGTVFASGLSYPASIAFDSAGNLYVAEQGNGTIEEFNTNGVGTVFASGLTGIWGIAIEVPEPSTWALVGLGLSALLVFRRKA